MNIKHLVAHVFMNMVNTQNASLSYKYPTSEHMPVYANM